MQPVAPIEVRAPVPSILTTAQDRTRDGFGTSVPAADTPEGSDLPASSASWREGISWTSIACQPSGTWPQCPSVVMSREEIEDGKQSAQSVDVASSAPFWIYVPLKCDWTLARSEWEAAADAAVLARTAFRMGRELWMGETLPTENSIGTGLADQVTLRRAAINISPGGAPGDLDDVVALLLGAYEMATDGAGGAMLHLPSVLMTGALGGLPGGGKVATPEGNLYRGPLGSLVSPGPGYPWGASAAGAGGYGPRSAVGPPEAYEGNDADEAWVYVTGPVEYALGELLPHHTPVGAELRQNRMVVLAERQAIFRFDPCPVYAAKAVVPLTLQGS